MVPAVPSWPTLAHSARGPVLAEVSTGANWEGSTANLLQCTACEGTEAKQHPPLSHPFV